MTKETEARWVERIREWRASGLSAKDFAMAKGYKASTLSWAASLLQRASESSPPTVPVAGEVHPRARAERRRPSSSKTPRFLPVHTLNWDGAFNDNERPKGLLCDRGGFRVSSSADKLCAAYSQQRRHQRVIAHSDAHDDFVVPEFGKLHEPCGAAHLGHVRPHRVKPVDAHPFVAGAVDEEQARVPSANVRDG